MFKLRIFSARRCVVAATGGVGHTATATHQSVSRQFQTSFIVIDSVYSTLPWSAPRLFRVTNHVYKVSRASPQAACLR